MSAIERYGTRDLTYSRWHRAESMKRFVSWEEAEQADMIDIDWLESCAACGNPLWLTETAQDVGQVKSARYLTALAIRARVPCFLVLYTADEDGDIVLFRVRLTTSDEPMRELSPSQWAQIMSHLRGKHECPARTRREWS